MKKSKLLLASFLVSATLLVPVIVYADHGEETVRTGNSSEQTRIEAEKAKKKADMERELVRKKTEFEAKRTAARDKATTGQDEMKKKACENRAESFKKRMQGITERSTKRVEVFNKIAERVQAFAKDKGVSVPDYDHLVADVELKKTALTQAHELAKENAGVFQCDGDNAKTNTAIFKETIQDEHQAFKDYRDFIKNLIKAVRQAVETNKQGSNNE